MEKALGKPVVTSNQCSLWAALKLIGAPAGKNTPGRLFEGMRQQ